MALGEGEIKVEVEVKDGTILNLNLNSTLLRKDQTYMLTDVWIVEPFILTLK